MKLREQSTQISNPCVTGVSYNENFWKRGVIFYINIETQYLWQHLSSNTKKKCESWLSSHQSPSQERNINFSISKLKVQMLPGVENSPCKESKYINKVLSRNARYPGWKGIYWSSSSARESFKLTQPSGLIVCPSPLVIWFIIWEQWLLQSSMALEYITLRTRDAIMSLLRQNDVAALFWHNNDVIIASCVRWVIVLTDFCWLRG